MSRLMVAAAIVACIEAEAMADLPPLVAWSQSGSSSVQFSAWSGTAWSAAASTASVGSTPYWVVIRACPSRDEIGLLSLGSDSGADVMTWNGASWTAPTNICSNIGATMDRAGDLAYTGQSGTMVAAYWKDDSKTIGYRTAGGGALASEQSRSLPSQGRVRYIKLLPVPGSDDVIGLFLNDGGGLYASTFSGSTFGTVTTIDSNATYDGGEAMAMVFESVSGIGLLVYSEKDQSSPRYRTFTAGVWSAESSAPSVGAGASWIRLAAEDGSDRVVMLTLNTNKDIHACVWNGSSWGSVQAFESDVGHSDVRVMDVVCPGGGGALAAFLQKDQPTIRYRSLTGSSWSSEQTGPNLGDAVMIVQAMRAGPAGEAWVVASDAGADLSVMRWNGTALSLSSTCSTSLGGDPKSECFMMCVHAGAADQRPRITQWQHVKPE